VISQTAKDRPQGLAIAWLGKVRLAETFLSAITFAELRRGIEKLPAGKKRRELDTWLRDEGVVEYRARIFALDEVVADLAGKISVEAERVGLHIDLMDTLIAATARVHGLKVATLNRKNFEKLGVELVEF
jgi:predicted nucleic acid-binding protein